MSLRDTAVVLVGRSDSNKESVGQLGEALAPLLPTTLFSICCNEQSRPSSIAEAIEGVIQQGAKRVLVVPAALVLEGAAFEAGITQALEWVRSKFPQIPVEYVWPLDQKQGAGLLAAHIRQAASRPPPDTRSLVAQFLDNQSLGGNRHG